MDFKEKIQQKFQELDSTNKHDKIMVSSTQATSRLVNNLEIIQKQNYVILFLFLISFLSFTFTKLFLLCNAINFILILIWFVNRQKKIGKLKKEYDL